jgi:hypothetical protein
MSKEFAMDVKDYYRDAANRNYQFLIRAISQHIALQRMERNRQSQIAILGGSPPPKERKANAAGKGGDNSGSSGGKNQAPKGDATKLLCFAFQTGECNYGNECRYDHRKISKEEFDGIKRKREEAMSQKAGTKGKKGKKGKGPGSRASTPGPTGTDEDKVCRSWRAGRPCPRLASGQHCPFEHPAHVAPTVTQQKAPANEGTQDPAATGTALPNAAVAFMVSQDGEFSPFSRLQRVGPSPCVDGYALIFRGSAGQRNGDGGENETRMGCISWGPATVYEVEYPDDTPRKKFEKLAPYRYGDHPARAQPHHRHLASLTQGCMRI